jgi:hypothetical protein
MMGMLITCLVNFWLSTVFSAALSYPSENYYNPSLDPASTFDWNDEKWWEKLSLTGCESGMARAPVRQPTDVNIYGIDATKDKSTKADGWELYASRLANFDGEPVGQLTGCRGLYANDMPFSCYITDIHQS